MASSRRRPGSSASPSVTACDNPPVKRADFSYELPPELIAQEPLPDRSASRLLVFDAARDVLEDRAFRELPELLEPGDLLVFNDTRVLPARMSGTKDSGGEVEILLERV